MTAERATDCDRSLLELSGAQVLAVNALAAGATHEAAAEAAGVHRVTVSRWVRHHPAVVAELRARRADASRELGEKIRAVTMRALDVVAGEVEAGNVRVSLAWLRCVPLAVMADEPDGPTDPAEVLEAARRELPDDGAKDLLYGRTFARTEAAVRARLEGARLGP